MIGLIDMCGLCVFGSPYSVSVLEWCSINFNQESFSVFSNFLIWLMNSVTFSAFSFVVEVSHFLLVGVFVHDYNSPAIIGRSYVNILDYYFLRGFYISAGKFDAVAVIRPWMSLLVKSSSSSSSLWFLIMKSILSFFGIPVANISLKLRASSSMPASLDSNKFVIRSFLPTLDYLLLRIDMFSFFRKIRMCFLLSLLVEFPILARVCRKHSLLCITCEKVYSAP